MSLKSLDKYFTLKFSGAVFAAASMPVSIILVTPYLLHRFDIGSVAQYNEILLGLNVVLAFFQGLFTLTIKEMSSGSAVRFVRFFYVERFMLITCILACPALIWLGQPSFLVIILLVLANFYSAVLVGLGAQFAQGFSLGIIHLSFAVLVWVFSATYDSAVQIFYVYALCGFGGLILLRVILAMYISGNRADQTGQQLDWREFRQLSVAEGLGILSSLVDRMAVFLLMPSAAFGLYSLASTVGKAPALIRSPLLRVFTPYLLSGTGDQVHKTGKVVLVFCSVIIPSLFGISIFCEQIFDLWIGGVSDEVITITRIILVGVGFHTCAVPFYYSLVSLDYTPTLLKITFFLLLGSVLTLILVSFSAGMAGLALVWTASMFATLIACCTLMIRHFREDSRIKPIAIATVLTALLPTLPLLWLV